MRLGLVSSERQQATQTSGRALARLYSGNAWKFPELLGVCQLSYTWWALTGSMAASQPSRWRLLCKTFWDHRWTLLNWTDNHCKSVPSSKCAVWLVVIHRRPHSSGLLSTRCSCFGWSRLSPSSRSRSHLVVIGSSTKWLTAIRHTPQRYRCYRLSCFSRTTFVSPEAILWNLEGSVQRGPLACWQSPWLSSPFRFREPGLV